MTADQTKKIQEAINLIALSINNQDGGWRAEMGLNILKELLDESQSNPFTEHWRNDEQS